MSYDSELGSGRKRKNWLDDCPRTSVWLILCGQETWGSVESGLPGGLLASLHVNVLSQGPLHGAVPPLGTWC